MINKTMTKKGDYSSFIFPIFIIIIWFILMITTIIWGIFDLIHIYFLHLSKFLQYAIPT